MSSSKKTFLRELAEALVIRVPKFEDQPKVEEDSFNGDLINGVLLRPVYRRPKNDPKP